MEKRPGRVRDNKKYDLYKVEDAKETYIGRFVRDVIRDTYGINTKNLKKDIEAKKLFEGVNGSYQIYPAGEFKPQSTGKSRKQEPRFSGMPEHVETVKLPGGCRFHG